MKTTFRKLTLPLIILVALGIFYACQKINSESASVSIPTGKSKLSVFLTDGPYDFQKVMIDIKSIQVLVDTCHQSGDQQGCQFEQHEGENDHHEGEGDNYEGDGHEGDDNDGNHNKDTCLVWTDLQINPGIYDLLTLRNGNDTLLGATFIPQGTIRKIKIILGTNNSVMADSIVSPLKIKGDSDFVIINICHNQLDSISPGNFHLILDFNLAKSIKFDDGVYWLKPELKAFSKKNTGVIEGAVGPDDSFGMIKAFNATDTAYALPDRDEEGEFKIRGLNEGTYSVLIQGANGYMDSTINNVQVLKAKETDLGKIILHK